MTTQIILISIAILVSAILIIEEDKKNQHNKKLFVLQQTVNRNKLKDSGCDIDHFVQSLEGMNIHYTI